MPNTYTQEQIEQAIKHFKQIEKLGAEYMNQDRYHALTILAALEAAEQERDALLEAAKIDLTEKRIVTDEPRIDLNAWKSYAARLEGVDDGLADYHRPLNTVPRWQDSLNAWEAARKEKP